MTVAPALVAVATLAGRRWGDSAAGLVAGFPIVAGPALFFYAFDQGPVYASGAALATLMGVLSLSAFILAYAWRAWSGGTPLSALALGWVAFAFSTALIDHVMARQDISLLKALLYALAALFLSYRSLPPASDRSRPLPPSPFDLPLRMAAAALLVWGLTASAQRLGPRLGGLLTPFPVASTVLAVFAHRQGGSEAVRGVLKGLLLALNAFAVFCAVLALALTRTGLIESFAAAYLTAGIVQGAIVLARKKGPSPPPAE